MIYQPNIENKVELTHICEGKTYESCNCVLPENLNILYAGDAMNVMPFIPPDTFDLIYLDPIYFLQREIDLFIPKHGGIYGDITKNYDNAYVDRYFKFKGYDQFKNIGGEYVAFMNDFVYSIFKLLKQGGYLVWQTNFSSSYLSKQVGSNVFGNRSLLKSEFWDYYSCKFNKDFYEILIYQKNRFFRRSSYPYVHHSNFTTIENRDYPTQKPSHLLKYFLNNYSKEGDLVGDFTCGSGAFLTESSLLNRRWFGCDINPLAIESTLNRFVSNQVLRGKPDIIVEYENKKEKELVS